MALLIFSALAFMLGKAKHAIRAIGLYTQSYNYSTMGTPLQTLDKLGLGTTSSI